MSAVSYACEAGIAHCRLDRPERGNALSPELVRGIGDALARACADGEAHTLVLHGSGKHFCTGFDLGDLPEASDASLLARFIDIELLLDALWRAPIRTVAIGHGAVVGAGADLFASCDERILAHGASLRFPGAGFGIALGTRRLACRVGSTRALRWVASNTLVPANEALASGLASAVLAPSDPEARVAAALALVPPLAVRRDTLATLRTASVDRDSDADLAALVRSAARPGLKARIAAYVEAASARRAARVQS